MKPIVRQRLGLLVLLLFPGSYAYGGPNDWASASLTICNKGTAGINVVVAVEPSVFLGSILKVSGWVHLSPGDCELVYQEAGTPANGSEPAYIGFGFADSQNHITAGHIEQVPDFGQFPFGTKVLTKSTRRLCVRNERMAYVIKGNPACESFHSDKNDPGGYFPLASALYIRPIPLECNTFNRQTSCFGGHYYLNIKPTANDRELHASAGSESGKDQPPAEPGIGDAIMKGFAKAAAENAKAAAEKRQAEAQAQAAGRENVKVCVPASLIEAWRNPPSGSKMERFQQHLTNALRIHAEDPESDMTLSWTVDDRVYPTYDPATPLGNVVYSGRACPPNVYREMLPIGEGTRNAAPSKPAPAPVPNRSMTPEDDPIGDGGLITPYKK